MKTTYIDNSLPTDISEISPLVPKAISEMRRLLDENAPDGSYKIVGDELFINVMTYETKPRTEGMFETHRDYADIQMMIEGIEEIGFTPNPEGLSVTEPYRPDFELYAMTDAYEGVAMERGKLCIILPREPHAPGIAPDGIPHRVRKMVAKVRLAANNN